MTALPDAVSPAATAALGLSAPEPAATPTATGPSGAPTADPSPTAAGRWVARARDPRRLARAVLDRTGDQLATRVRTRLGWDGVVARVDRLAAAAGEHRTDAAVVAADAVVVEATRGVAEANRAAIARLEAEVAALRETVRALEQQRGDAAPH